MKSTPISVLQIVKEQKIKFCDVFEKFAISVVEIVGSAKLGQMSQISKDMSAAAPSLNLDQGWKTEKKKEKM